MSITTETTSIADDLIARIEKWAPDIEAQADANEQAGRLNDVTLGILDEIGLMKAMDPAEYGGLDLTIYDVMRVYEALSYVDSAAGWVAMIPGVQGKGLLLLDESSRDNIAKDGYPFIAGQGAPGGRATVTDGGYRVSGHWSYGSAVLHCDTVTGVAVVVDDNGPVLDAQGNPDAILFWTPVANAKVETNWDVLGLRATGSVDYSISDVFVPNEYVARNPFTGALGGRGQAKLLGFTGWIMSVHSAVPLGAGRRLLDELAAFARAPRSRGPRLADDTRFAHAYGKAEAEYRSSRAFMYEALGEAQERMNRGEPATRRDLTNLRAASVRLHDVNAENATFALRESGGTGLRAGQLQRLYRDIMAMGQHIQASQQTWVEITRDYLAEAENLSWALNRLV